MASSAQAGDRTQVLREWFAGYAGASFGQDAAELEILDLGGKVLRIGWEQVKWVCYVRDFPAARQLGQSRSGSCTSASPSARGLPACGCA